MEIRVRCNCGEGSCEEWGIVELQGVVEPQPGFHDSLPNLHIGTLCRPSSQVPFSHPSFFLSSYSLFNSIIISIPFLIANRILTTGLSTNVTHTTPRITLATCLYHRLFSNHCLKRLFPILGFC